MDALVAAYPGIFPQDRTAPEDGHDAGEDPDAPADADGPADDFAARWGWYSLIDTVSETQRCSWDDVLRKPMVETLNTFAYTKDRNARRADELEQYKKTH